MKIADTPGDARSITFSLTPRGRKLLDKVLLLAFERQKHFLSVLTPVERETLYRTIAKLRNAALN